MIFPCSRACYGALCLRPTFIDFMQTDPSASAPVLTTLHDGVLTVTLNRPQALNSFTKAMHAALQDALAQANQPQVRVVVLTGGGRGFCAGQDLADLDADSLSTSPTHNILLRHYNPLITRLRNLPKPVMAAVNGVAAGAGANLALACDIVIATKSALFLQAFVHIGLLPDSGGTYFLPRMVGTAQAAALMMLGDKLSAQDAAHMGLIYRCVEDDQFPATVQATAAKLAALPPKALAAMKQALYHGYSHLEAQLALEATLQTQLAASADYAEGVAAFLEKRRPVFSGQ
jgi:2-(1,2-epoxy-1,2-dihydrophenyl)acetyl-CoA isomerase